jgi:predicted AlkP superfamily phosphohydrolase/phosphomutase
MSASVLLVGWDGADWSVLDPLIDRGILPNVAALKLAGRAGVLRSTFPPHSAAAWTSFLTGVPAGTHGIVDFRSSRSGSRFPDEPHSSLQLGKATLLHALSGAGRRILSVNIPMTFPPFPVSGMLVSGVFLPENARFTYPSELQDGLGAIGGFPVNGIRWVSTGLRSLLAEAVTVEAQRSKVFLDLLTRERWDIALFGVMAPDRLQHPGMHLLAKGHPLSGQRAGDEQLHDELMRVYAGLDDSLGRVLDAAHADHVCFMSDHGFRPVWQELAVNTFLARLGRLRFRVGVSPFRRALRTIRAVIPKRFVAQGMTSARRLEARIDWDRTEAYCPSAASQGIRLNVRGRDDRGAVPRSRVDDVLDRLIVQLREARGPDGERVFGWVRAAEDVFGSRSRVSGFPDIVFAPASGVAVSLEAAAVLGPLTKKTGDHREEGVIIQAGPDEGRLPRHVWEVPQELLRLVGADPAALDADLVGEAPASQISATEQASIEEHLRGLGYVE